MSGTLDYCIDTLLFDFHNKTTSKYYYFILLQMRKLRQNDI